MDLNQVTVQSIDIGESISFYKDLGLTLIVQSDDYARFECPNGNSTFSVHLVQELKPSNTIIYFEVKNLERDIQTLKSKGLKFTKELANESWLWSEARLLDPSENEVCIFKAGENRKNPPWRIA